MRVNVAPSLLYDRKILGRRPNVEATFQVLIVHVDTRYVGVWVHVVREMTTLSQRRTRRLYS